MRCPERRASTVAKSLVSVVFSFLLVLSSVSFLTAAAATASSGVASQLPGQLAPNQGSFTPDYYLLGQLKQGNVYQTQRPRSLPLQSGTQFAADYYTPGDFQGAYHLTDFLASGGGGRGVTIAIIDAYGDPEIAQDLSAFDLRFGLPQANLSIVPVGPYEPSLGITTGWDAEVALDVEAAHMMAPLANINLVIASNDSNGLFYAIKDVVTNHLGNVVSMSWGLAEDLYGLSGFSSQGILNYPYADYYFSLGASEGITFLSASGDTGAFGGTTSPTGGASFPATSPFVTAVGGTTLFLTPYFGTFAALDSAAAYQSEDAWSISPQYIGTQTSSGGGYSSLFAKPSYQDGVVSGNVRAIPDVSADANPYTGMVVVIEGGLYIEGGTSLSTAMWAGMAADLDQYVGRPLGALNPYFYSIYQNKGLYDEAFNQVTSGYNGAYQAGTGYNLVTGLGSPDFPNLANAVGSLAPGLSVKVQTSKSPIFSLPQYAYGDTFSVAATVKSALGAVISTGVFTTEIDSASGLVVIVPLSFNGSDWEASYTIQSGSPPGVWSITVSGSSGGAVGQGSTDIVVGMSMALVSPVPYPLSAPIPPNQPFPLEVNVSNPNGTPISDAVLTAHFLQGGKDLFDVHLSARGGGRYSAEPVLVAGMPQGTYILIVNGTGFGSVLSYVYFGEGLVGAMLTPTDDAIPSASPGQQVALIASPSTAESTGTFTSEVTASIFALDGTLVAAVTLQPAPNAVQFGVFNFFYYQQANFTIPTYLQPGFYRLAFTSSYNGNSTTGLQLGSYSTGFYVSGPTVGYSLARPSAVFEGQFLKVTAKIVDSSGTSVDSGVFNLNVLPSQLAYASAYYGSLLLSGVPMQYNASLGEWTASYFIPSVLTQPFYYSNDPAVLSGSWTLLVSGESSSSENAASTYSYVNVLPCTLIKYDQLNPSTISGASLVTFNGTSYALDSAGATGLTVRGLTLSLGEDRIDNLTVFNSTVDIVGSQISSMTAVDSTVVLHDDTSVGSLSLTGSTVAVSDSTYQTILPALPIISVGGFSQPISGTANFTITVNGEQLAAGSLTATIDGVKVPLAVTPTVLGLTATVIVNASAMSDGVHTLFVTAPQTDGLSASLSSFFSTDAQSASLKIQINSLQGALQSLSGTVKSLDGQLESTSSEVTNVTYSAYVLAVVAVVSLAVAVYALRRRPGAQAIVSAG